MGGGVLVSSSWRRRSLVVGTLSLADGLPLAGGPPPMGGGGGVVIRSGGGLVSSLWRPRSLVVGSLSLACGLALAGPHWQLVSDRGRGADWQWRRPVVVIGRGRMSSLAARLSTRHDCPRGVVRV